MNNAIALDQQPTFTHTVYTVWGYTLGLIGTQGICSPLIQCMPLHSNTWNWQASRLTIRNFCPTLGGSTGASAGQAVCWLNIVWSGTRIHSGFSLSRPLQSATKNIPYAYQHQEILDEYIAKELGGWQFHRPIYVTITTQWSTYTHQPDWSSTKRAQHRQAVSHYRPVVSFG